MSVIELSVVIPVYNEVSNIKFLYDSIAKAIEGIRAEIIFIDDGSIDGTAAQVLDLDLSKGKHDVKLVKFKRNFGQTAAMSAGIDHAVGDYIVTLDGDLQNDPSDIPVMLKRIKAENLDLLVGRRRNRQDNFLLRKIPSILANLLIRKTTKVYVTDYGCSLKIFRSELAKKLELYGELHRFIPVLASLHGAKIAEMDVKHHPRKYGESKYGISRTIRVVSDWLLMLFFIRYRQRPMHLFGTIAQLLLAFGFIGLAYLGGLKLFGESVGGRPLFMLSLLLVITGIQFLCTGFIAELLTRTYFAIEGKKPYTIEKVYICGKEQDL